MKKEKILLKKILNNKVIHFLRCLKNGNYYYFLWVLPVKRNKIVVSSYFGKGYGDNGKYIVNKLLENDTELDIVWFLKKEMIKNQNSPDKVRTVRYGSLRSLYEMATAGVWIDNTRKVLSPPKRKNQFYIQTWHSPLRLKKIEKDTEEVLSDSYIHRAQTDSKNCDLMIAGCDYSYDIYRNSFWYDGEILKCGTPRCDIFFKESSEYKEKVCNYYKIDKDVNLILYAPTFRNIGGAEKYSLDYQKITVAASKKFGGRWKILFRLHPNISFLSSSIALNDNCINATFYDDMQELLAASEILITDYSSCMFDMAIAGKKCFIHAIDLGDYLIKEREHYFRICELPFPFSDNEKKLVSNIIDFDSAEYKKNLEKFGRKVNFYEKGTASQKLAEIIDKRILESVKIK